MQKDSGSQSNRQSRLSKISENERKGDALWGERSEKEE